MQELNRLVVGEQSISDAEYGSKQEHLQGGANDNKKPRTHKTSSAGFYISKYLTVHFPVSGDTVTQIQTQTHEHTL